VARQRTRQREVFTCTKSGDLINMDDISNAITILADKVGIGVDTLYQLNLSVQMIKAVFEIATSSIAVLISIIVIIKSYYTLKEMIASDESFDDNDLVSFMLWRVGIICVVIVVLLALHTCTQDIALRIYCPEYMAMKDTLVLVGDMIKHG